MSYEKQVLQQQQDALITQLEEIQKLIVAAKNIDNFQNILLSLTTNDE
jgi:hypothetical protein